MDGSESEMKMGGKGGKGKRRQKNNSVSSSPGNINKEGIHMSQRSLTMITLKCLPQSFFL